MNNIQYIGNSAYCYANSASMLLASIGEEVSSSVIEVLTGVGLSATYKIEKDSLYFNNQMLQSDLGITKALNLLSFKVEQKIFEDPEYLPLKEFKDALHISSVVIGPLDMGYLVYNPSHEHLYDEDHFLFVYAIDHERIYLHDPNGFPHVSLLFKDLKPAWQSKNILKRFIETEKHILTKKYGL